MLARLLVVVWAWVLVSGCGAEPEAAPPTSHLTKPIPGASRAPTQAQAQALAAACPDRALQDLPIVLGEPDEVGAGAPACGPSPVP